MKKKYNCISVVSVSKAIIIAFFVVLPNLLSAQQSPSIQSGVTFQWSDTQKNKKDPATIKSITINDVIYNTFVVPSGYELSRLGPDGHKPNQITKNGNKIVKGSNSNDDDDDDDDDDDVQGDGSAFWNRFALSAFQDKNLNHYFTANPNGKNICLDFEKAAETKAQKQTIFYSPSIPANEGGVLAVTERNANNCFYIGVFGTPVGGGPEQLLGQTFSRNTNGLYGPLLGPPNANSDYWKSGRVVENNGTIGIALFYLSDIVPTGSKITKIEFTAATKDHGDGKFFLLQKYAVDQQETQCVDNEFRGSVDMMNNVPQNSTYRIISGPNPAGKSFTFNTDGSYYYMPNDGYIGDVTFEYEVCLPEPNTSACDSAKVTLTYMDLPSEPEIDVSCSSTNNFVISVTNPVGEEIEYSLNNGAFQASPIYDNLPEGTYSIKVRNKYTTCEIENPENPIILTNLEATATKTDIECAGESTGSITIAATGGTRPYQYSLDNGNTNQTDSLFEGLTAGNYTVLITDANECTINVIVSININDNEDPQITVPETVSFEGCELSDITTANAIFPFSEIVSEDVQNTFNSNIDYDASDDRNIQSITYSDEVLPGSCPKEVLRTFTVTDNCGNKAMASQTIIIEDNTPPVLDAVARDLTVQCNDQSQNALDNWLSSNGNAFANSDCGEVVWSNNYSSLSNLCGETGSATVTFTATDNCNNSVSTTATFTIEDTVGPTIVGFPSNVNNDMSSCVNVPTLSFINYTEVEGDGNNATFLEGEVFRFSNVSDNLDALLTIVATVNATIPAIDNNNNTEPNALKPKTAFKLENAGDRAYVEYRLDFVLANTNTPVNLPEFYTNFNDVDGNNNFREINWTQFSNSYTVNDPTDLTITEEGPWIVATSGNKDYDGVTNVNPQANISTKNSNASSYRFRLGVEARKANVSGNGRLHSIEFSCISNYTNPETVVDEITVECSDLKPAETLTAVDECSNATVTLVETRTDGDCENNYILNRTWTATDECGNETKRTLIINVVDTTPPTISVPADVTIECGEDETSTNTGTATGSDTCSDVVISQSDVVTSLCGNSKEILRTWTATDNCGNQTSAEQTITVTDSTDPVFNEDLPADITVTFDTIPAAETLTASDACDSSVEVIFTETENGNYCDISHTIIRTWSAEDDCGNAIKHTQTITVEHPILSSTVISVTDVLCKGDSTGNIDLTVDGGTAPYTYLWNTGATTEDLIDIIAGSYSVTVTDANGCEITNEATVAEPNENVTGSITEITNVECSGENTGSITVEGSGGIPPYTYSIDDGTTNQSSGLFENLMSGNYTVLITDANGCTFSVNGDIISDDNENPEISVPSAITIDGCSTADITTENAVFVYSTSQSNDIKSIFLSTTDYNASDDFNILSITYSDTIISTDNCPIVVSRIFTITDNCNNTAIATQSINIADTTTPTFNEDLPTDVTLECNSIPSAANITATDNCGEATVTFVETTTAGTCANEFKLVRTWTATDSCNNSISHVQTIDVIDNTGPSFNEDLPLDDDAECDAVPTAPTLTATEGCGSASATVTFEEDISNGACIGDFIITRTWTAIDSCNNETVHTQILTVQDSTAPMLVTAFDETVTVSCDGIPAIPDLVFEDACSNNIDVSFNEDSSQANDFEDYQIIRTWTVKDDCNNEATFTQTITVEISNVIDAFDTNRCVLDSEFDLFDLLSGDFNMNGSWSVVSGDATLDGSFFDPSTVEVGMYTFKYSITEGPCPTEIEVNITIDDDCVVLACGKDNVLISKTVTANGDNFNEFFTITGIEECGFVIELQVFNRWGAKVYENRNYQNNWNGDAHSSSVGSSGKVPTGTYYYIINLRNSGLEPFAGPIYVATK